MYFSLSFLLASSWAQRVNLVDEDRAGRVEARHLEQQADKLLTLTSEEKDCLYR